VAGLSSYTQGSNTSALTTELNSLANNTYSAAGSAQDNSSNHDIWADFLATVTFGTSPTVGTSLDLYVMPALESSSQVYSDGGGAVAPSGALYVGSFILRAVTTAQNVHVRQVPLPPGSWRVVLHNNGTGQTLAASGNTVTYRSYKTS
jgi:hypothetical protein